MKPDNTANAPSTPSRAKAIEELRQVVIDRVVDVLMAEHPRVVVQLEAANVIVTGALGFFGRYVVDVLLELWARRKGPDCPGGRVFAMDTADVPADVWEGRWRKPKYAEFLTTIKHDARHQFNEFGGTDLTHVWHLAGIASPYWYKRKPFDTIAVTVDGLRKMMTLAQEHGASVVFTSSSEVYQTADIVPTPESYVGAIPTRTERSCYDVSKALGETLNWLAYKHTGLHAVTVRIFNSFGPGLVEEDRRILTRIGSVIRRDVTDPCPGGNCLKVYVPPGCTKDALPTRTYTPVANTLLGFFISATCGAAGGMYNIGLDKPELSVVDLVERIKKLNVTDSKLWTEMVPAPDNYETEPLRRCPDVTALKSLGYLPCMDLDEGLKLFFEYVEVAYRGIP